MWNHARTENGEIDAAPVDSFPHPLRHEYVSGGSVSVRNDAVSGHDAHAELSALGARNHHAGDVTAQYQHHLVIDLILRSFLLHIKKIYIF